MPRVPQTLRYQIVATLILAGLHPWFLFRVAYGNPGAAPTEQSTRSNGHPAHRSATNASERHHVPPRLAVKSKIALVEDVGSSRILFEKNADQVAPIASITKLMTAIVALDAKLPLNDMLTISEEDRDLVMSTSSRLKVGWSLTREDMLHLALMSSENRAAAALSRYYPGGRRAFIRAMNAKAAALRMNSTHFVNPNGLTNENVSTAFDLVKLVQAAYQYPLIRAFTTDPGYLIQIGRHLLAYHNTNRLIDNPDWDIEVQKTGFTNRAGDCLVMRTNVEGRTLVMVFLDASGKLTRFADARRVRQHLMLAAVK